MSEKDVLHHFIRKRAFVAIVLYLDNITDPKVVEDALRDAGGWETIYRKIYPEILYRGKDKVCYKQLGLYVTQKLLDHKQRITMVLAAGRSMVHLPMEFGKGKDQADRFSLSGDVPQYQVKYKDKERPVDVLSADQTEPWRLPALTYEKEEIAKASTPAAEVDECIQCGSRKLPHLDTDTGKLVGLCIHPPGFYEDIRHNKDPKRQIYVTPHMDAYAVYLAPGESISMEIHENATQFFQVMSGRGVSIVGGKTERLREHSMFWIPPGTEHEVRADPEMALHMLTIYSPPEHHTTKV